jgi:hypothetical protein
LLATASASAGALPPPDYYGLNVQPLTELSLVPSSQWPGFISTMASDGLRSARVDLPWQFVEPNAPTASGHTYVWYQPNHPAQSMDTIIGLLAASHVQPIAVIGLAPRWTGGSGTTMTPAHYPDFAAFAAAAAARYGVGGSFWSQNPQLPYEPVLDFEIWNEANSANFWTGSANPAAYASGLAQASAAIHAVDPSANVLASIGWQGFQTFVSQLYAAGVGANIDGIAFHPYAPDAPGILLLNEELRSTLDSVGAPGLPIYDDEVGQYVVTSGQGATFAYDGLVTDAARAATETLAGDALARSDCGVEDYLLYGITDSSATQGPDQSIGLFSVNGDQPDVTATTLIAASAQWQAQPSGGIVLCGSGTTPVSALLPLGVELSRTGPTCAAATITYRGEPLEGAQLVLRTADGRVAPAGTNAYGQTQMCLQNGPAITQFTAQAELPGVAASATYTCPVSLAACVVSAPPAPSGAGGPGGASAAGHRYSLLAKIVRQSGRATTISVRLVRAGARAAGASLGVWIRRAGAHARKQWIANDRIRSGRRLTLTFRPGLRAGERVVLAIAADVAVQRPYLTRTLTVR